MSNKDKEINAETVLKELDSFCGTENFYSTVGLKLSYTDGVKYLAEKCKAYWLITDINAVVGTILKHHEIIFIQLTKVNKIATVMYTDGNENILFSQSYTYTDFILDSINLMYQNKVLCLFSEW